MTVSFLMCVKNGLPFLSETLESIACQTFRDFQLLVWDNGSNDGTKELLAEWVPGRIPGRLFLDDPLPLGLSRARLISLADTEWCATIDSDDVCLPHRLDTQMAFLRSSPDVDVLGSSAILIDELGHAFPRLWSFPEKHQDILTDMVIGQLCPYCHSSTIFRRNELLKIGNYRLRDEWGGCHIEDWDLALRLAAQGSCFANLTTPTVKYRVRSGSTTAQRLSQGALIAAAEACLAEHAENLSGLSSAVYKEFMAGNLPFALPSIFAIAKKLRRGLPVGRLLRDRRFLQRVAVRLSRKDVVTRLVLRLMFALSEQNAYECPYESALRSLPEKKLG